MSDKNVEYPTDSGDSGYEKRDVNLTKVLLYGIAGIIILTAVVIFALDYFTAAREEAVYEAVLKPESVPLRELRARETEELNSYAVLDADRGIYRIPIKLAMALIAEEAFRDRAAEARKKK